MWKSRLSTLTLLASLSACSSGTLEPTPPATSSDSPPSSSETPLAQTPIPTGTPSQAPSPSASPTPATTPTATAVPTPAATAVPTPTATAAPLHLEGYWPLEGDFSDPLGQHSLTASRTGGFSANPFVHAAPNLGYGPTGYEDSNGGSSLEPFTLDDSQGLTLEGWMMLPDNNTGGVLFGFQAGGWGYPKLFLSAAWGFLQVNGGSTTDSVVINYGRYGDTCWHHVALVLPPGYNEGVPFQVYVDGQEDTATTIDRSPTGTTAFYHSSLFGGPFKIGAFSNTSGDDMRVDEVRLWSRALSAAEVQQQARPSGTGAQCVYVPPEDWIPGPLCTFPSTLPLPQLKLSLFALTAQETLVLADPTEFLEARMREDCGTFLTALEENRASVPDWKYGKYYHYALLWTQQTYRPLILAALDTTDAFTLEKDGTAWAPPTTLSVWPQAFREARILPMGVEDSEINRLHLLLAEEGFYAWLGLPAPLQNGETLRVSDDFGDAAQLTYDDTQTLSLAIKVDQVGYARNAGRTLGYLGAWKGLAGPLDLSAVEGQPFQLIRERDGSTAFTGYVTFRSSEQYYDTHPLYGEDVYALDFSAASTSLEPGRYHLQVAGVGISHAFTVGNEALGEAFFTYARGLFHQRCAPLSASHTAWARGDIHATFTSLAPPESEDYKDHSAEGWGFLDETGAYAQHSMFELNGLTGTQTALPDVRGGWHDAADFDRNSGHLEGVENLIASWLLFPDHFTDGQLQLPESGNNIPDVLDEAIAGFEVFLLGMEPDGRVTTTLEATSHPKISDPGQDTQPYYRGLATRGSSLAFARTAARLARALDAAGATAEAERYLAAAERAFAFGTRADIRIGFTFTDPESGTLHSWQESAEPDPERRFDALVQLWLATRDPAYQALLEEPDAEAMLEQKLSALYWRVTAFDVVDIALNGSSFPEGWGTQVEAALVHEADLWLDRQESDAYRKVWYKTTDGYFSLMGWGHNGFNHIRWAVVAWRLTGQTRYRDAALLGVNWMQGTNPQGRVYTSGLGSSFMANYLHLPSDVDGLDEPVPGIPVYGITGGMPSSARSEVYGLYADPWEDYPGVALAQLPRPYNDTRLTSSEVGEILYDVLPVWRRYTVLEAQNVPQTEFTVAETVAVATAVTGALLEPGWSPAAGRALRAPRTRAELTLSWVYPP